MSTESEPSAAPRAPLTRSAIVAVARDIVAREGLDALSLRRLASELGVTAPALYAHVRDKQDLLAALADSGFRELIARYDETTITDPFERLERYCSIYVDMALASPGLFKVMFLFRPGAIDIPGVEDELPAATEAFAQPARAITDAIESGAIHPDHDPLLAALVLWTAAHGLAGVMTLGVSADPVGRRRLQTAVLGATLRGLGQPPSPGADNT